MFKKALGNIPAILYFFGIMWWVLIILGLAPLLLYTEIKKVHDSGFSTVNIGLNFIAVLGLLIGLSLIIPAFRKMYDKLPWMYLYVILFLVNTIIFTIALSIINYAYEVQNPVRNTMFYILMIVQIIACRLALSYYFYKKKYNVAESDFIE